MSSTASGAAGGSRLLSSVRTFAGRLRSDARLQAEIFWTLANRVIEVAGMFVALKLLTSWLGKDGYGEYSLAVGSLMLLTNVLIMPMNHAYMRYFHAARLDGAARTAGIQALRWLAAWTAVVPVLAIVLGAACESLFGLGRWTIIAAGFFFLTERWRGFGLEMFDMLRLRRAGAFFNLAWHTLTIALLVVLLRGWSATAGAALLAGALAGAPVAYLGIRKLLPELIPTEGRSAGALPSLVRSFGAPYAVLLFFQWLQTFADRYLLNAYLDLEAVGHYTAAFQVCGVPYLVFYATLHWLVMPIAYNRATNQSDPMGLWAADRALLGGLGAYLLGGAVMLGVYCVAGPWLVRILTHEEFALPAGTVALIALGRFVQCLGFLVQVFFAVHQRMLESMTIRIVGAFSTVPIVWWGVREAGLTGAAIGTLAAGCLYFVIVAVGPGGFIWLLRETRERALRVRRGDAALEASVAP